MVGRVGMMLRMVDNKLKQMRVRGMQIARVMWTMRAEMMIFAKKGGEGVARQNCHTNFISFEHKIFSTCIADSYNEYLKL